MNKIQSNAKKLDTIFKWVNRIVIFSIAIFIAALIAIIFLRRYTPDSGTLNSLGIGYLSFELSDELQEIQGNSPVLGFLTIFATIISLNLFFFSIKIIRNILSPIIAGVPFHDNTGNELAKLGWLSIIAGIVVNVIDIAMQAIIYATYDLSNIFINSNISRVTANYEFDLSFIITAAVIFLLAHIFKYGSELQQQVDETL